MKNKALRFKKHNQPVKGFIPEVRDTSREARLKQLQTMFANADYLNQPDSQREAEKVEVRAIWCLLKERFLASK